MTKRIESLMKKSVLTHQEVSLVVAEIRTGYWPRLRNEKAPFHCGLCELCRVCDIINHQLVCPWVSE